MHEQTQQNQHQSADVTEGAQKLLPSDSPNGQSRTGSEIASQSHCSTQSCARSFRLVEGPPNFFLATNPPVEHLEAFAAFAKKAVAIRQECMGEQDFGGSDRVAATDPASPPTRTKSNTINRTMSRTMSRPKAVSATASAISDAPPITDEPADANSTATQVQSDAYPEVPELAGGCRLLRFIQGFDYDVEAASEAYRRHMKWRKEMGLTARKRRAVVEAMLLPMRPEAAPRNAEISRFYPTNPLVRLDGAVVPSRSKCAAAAADATAPGDGNSLLRAVTDEALGSVVLDRQGNIVSIERPGLLDVNGLFTAVSEEDFLRWHSYLLEFRCMLLDVLSRKFNRIVRTTSIIDLKGLSARMLSRRTINLLRRTIAAGSENYPESIGAMFFINTPRTFSTLWSAMRGWLRERTISKITLLGSDSEAFLVKHIGGYALPPSLGGSCTSSLADVPPLFENRDTDLGPGSMILNVGARRCNQAVEIVPEKSVAQWVWVAEDFDVGFSAIWRTPAGHESVLEEYRKYPPRTQVRGIVSAEHEGTLILAFENTWGLISSRRVRYKIDIKPSGGLVHSRSEATSSRVSDS